MKGPYAAIEARVNRQAEKLEELAKRLRALAPQLTEGDDFSFYVESFTEKIEETIVSYEQAAEE